VLLASAARIVARTSKPASLRPPSTLPAQKSVSLVVWMLVAIAAVAGMAWWDEQREAESALHDLQSEQSVLAESIAAALRAHLTTIQREAALVDEHGPGEVAHRYEPVVVTGADAARAGLRDPKRLLLTIPVSGGRVVELGVLPRDLLDRTQQVGRPGELVLLLSPPDERSFHSSDGAVAGSPALRDAFDRGLVTLRLTRAEAAQVGLPARTSMAGLARIDAGDLGRWGIVTVASAARERDREKRAIWRLLLGVLVASGLVLAFGGAALRRQRKELELQHELAVAEVQRERDEQLLRAERVATMGTFAMGIAHEVSTPLGIIVGRAEQLLSKVREDERAVRSAQAILNQADRIQLIVRRFLDLARGGPPFLVRVDPSAIVRAAIEAVEHRFSKAKVALFADVPSVMRAIQCDRDLLEQAIVNLLLNACEACGEGGHVEIAARADAARVAFVVTDDGAGISPENARRATEPFFTTKPRDTSSGLGLAIATEIVKSHRGDLTIAPHAHRGTRARIEVPSVADRRDAAAHLRTELPGTRGSDADSA
jgi:signal transduction histidine kinase